MTRINIIVFAALKDYFSPSFEMRVPKNSIEGIKESLIQLNPKSAELLKSCRFAINETFITADFTIQENDTIAILPPSSGG